MTALAVLLLPSASTAAEFLRCPRDSVLVGPICVDKYEASVWVVPPSIPRLVEKIRRGRASLNDLSAAGAVQVGAVPAGTCTGLEYGAGFPQNGNWTAPVYAASIAGTLPSTCATWFQAEQACRLSGKRLLTNQEWQAAAAGTPDPDDADDNATTCATSSPFAVASGSRSQCVSSWGAYDMAGNVWEWIAEWINPALACTSWLPGYGGDLSCVGTVPEGLVSRELVEFDPNLPGAIIRGGNFATGARNGIFAFFAGVNPHNVSRSTGFRCARLPQVRTDAAGTDD
jgi:formylglycine-generating enzyme required for sulfatase activity